MAKTKHVKAIIQLRRATASEWTSVNPILHDGEPGLETDTHKLKAGDGETHWNDLPYLSDTEALDYEDLINKPSIEGIELIGDKSMRNLGVDTLSVQEIERILYLD